MKQKILRQDGTVFGVLSIVLFVLSAFQMPVIMISLAIAILSLFAYRHGTVALGFGCIVGAAATVFVFSLYKGTVNTFQLIYFGTVAGIPGLFAKNVHRTLNNRKMNSVILNVVVAQFIVSALVFGEVLVGDKLFTLLDVTYLFIVVSVLVILIAYIKPERILTKRSAFLSHKERSKLLND